MFPIVIIKYEVWNMHLRNDRKASLHKAINKNLTFEQSLMEITIVNNPIILLTFTVKRRATIELP